MLDISEILIHLVEFSLNVLSLVHLVEDKVRFGECNVI